MNAFPSARALHLLHQIQLNGYEVETREANRGVCVIIFDVDRRRETSFGLTPDNEGETLRRMAKDYCTRAQQEAILDVRI